MLKRMWEAWKRLAHTLGNFQARLLLTFFYALVVMPFGIVARLFADPLRIRRRPAQWLEHPNPGADMNWARRPW
jgi:hypothetical protein